MLASSRPKRVGSLVVIGAAGLAAAIVVLLLSRGNRAPDPVAVGPADSLASSDPLPLRRLADQDGGDLVLEAIEASGGWAAWSARSAARLTFEAVFFGESGSLEESRGETQLLTLHPPSRIRIESDGGAALAGFGRDGAWGAGRRSDGDWSPAAGPGTLPPRTLRDLTLKAWWFFGLPFNLGETDAVLKGPATRAPGDSLVRLDVAWPPSPGETAGRAARLGFDPESGHILEVFFGAAGSGGHHLLLVSGYREFEGLWRPTRRALFQADSTGQALEAVSEQRLTEVVWDPEITGEPFEAPPPP